MVALESMACRGFSYCSNGRNARPLRLSYICSICFGVMGVTLPGRPSYNNASGWNRSSILFRYPSWRLRRESWNLYRLAKEKELEGIIAKRKISTNRPGKRSLDWLKIKARPQQEFAVCGFTEGWCAK